MAFQGDESQRRDETKLVDLGVSLLRVVDHLCLNPTCADLTSGVYVLHPNSTPRRTPASGPASERSSIISRWIHVLIITAIYASSPGLVMGLDQLIDILYANPCPHAESTWESSTSLYVLFPLAGCTED